MDQTRQATRPACVPEVAAAVLESQGVEVAAWRRCRATTEQHPAAREVDLHRLAQTEPQAAQTLAEWWLDCQAFWDALRAGRWAGPYVQVRRPLARASIGDRRDMRRELDALESLAPLHALVREATTSAPDWGLVDAHAKLADGGSDPERGLVWATVVGGERWPGLLGGAGMPGLLARFVTVGTTHAAWRDRRGRRLTFVAVDGIEWWPEPQLVSVEAARDDDGLRGSR